MSQTARYLKQNVVAEPLYTQWYAWWSRLSPATALRGGPCIDDGVERARDIQELPRPITAALPYVQSALLLQ